MSLSKWVYDSRTAWLVFVLGVAAYVLVFLAVGPPLFQDYPNHLARVVVLDDLILHDGRRFGAAFQFQPLFAPYWLVDVFGIILLETLGLKYTSAFLPILVMLTVPAAFLLATRYLRTPMRSRAPFLLISLYLATSAFFLWGFLAFCLAIPLVILAYLTARLFRETRSLTSYGGFLLTLVAGYLTHLTALVFIAAAVGVSGLVQLFSRRSTLKSEAALLIPVGALFVWHLASSSRAGHVQDAALTSYSWGTVGLKLQNVFWPFLRYDAVIDLTLLAGFVVCLVLLSWGRFSFAALRDAQVLESLALAATFFAIFLVLPDTLSEAEHVDVRALPLAGFFLLLAIVQLREPVNVLPSAKIAGVALALSALLVLANLAYIGLRLHRLDAWQKQYRAAIATLPEGAKVLPVSTRVRKGFIRPEIHADGFVVSDRGGFVPYLFSADQGHPMKFFRYRQRPNVPDLTWYTQHPVPAVDWKSLACSFDFVVITKPFERERIGLQMVQRFENDAATVFALAPCP